MTRHDGRRPDQLRELDLQPDFLEQPHGSVLYAQGRTVVLCTATVEEDIPRWLRGKGKGWMTAEYSLLPASTGERTQRAVSRGRPDGRTVEIQRLIGRALRSVCDFQALGERTLWLDCDVLQADGGTRCAAITGAYVAAYRALDRFGLTKALPSSVAAVSVGVVDGEPVLDLDYVEDSSAETDMNVVMAADGRLVEVQATAEREPFSRELLDRLLDLAAGGIDELEARPAQRLRGAVAPLSAGRAWRQRAQRVTSARAARPRLGQPRTSSRSCAARCPAARSSSLGRDDPPPEDGATYADNARIKAALGAGATRPADAWVVGEDSGIEAVALGGAPGVRTARWAAGDPVGRMLEALAGEDERRARYVCVIVAIAPDGRGGRRGGRARGARSRATASGAEGFGFDPVFVPDGRVAHGRRARRRLEAARTRTAPGRPPRSRGLRRVRRGDDGRPGLAPRRWTSRARCRRTRARS